MPSPSRDSYCSSASMDHIRRTLAYPSPHSCTGCCSCALPLERVPDRFRDTRTIRSCGQHQVPGFSADLRLGSTGRTTSRDRTLRREYPRTRAIFHRSRFEPRSPYISLRPASRASLCSSGKFFFRNRGENLGCHRHADLLRLRVCSMAMLSSAAVLRGNINNCRPRLSPIVPLFRARPTFPLGTSLRHRGIPEFALRSAVACGRRVWFADPQASFPRSGSSDSAVRARMENPRWSRPFGRCSANLRPSLVWCGHNAVLSRCLPQPFPLAQHRGTESRSHPDAFPSLLLDVVDSIQFGRAWRLHPQFDCANQPDDQNLEFFRCPRPALLSYHVCRNPRQPASVCLRSFSAGSRTDGLARLDPGEPTERSRCPHSTARVPRVRSALIRPTFTLDASATLGPNLCRPGLDDVSFPGRRSQTCFQ